MNTPNPIAIHAFGLEIRWYGILIAAALLIALGIALRRSERYNIKHDDVLDLFLCLTPAIIVGARLYYVIFEWSYYSIHLDQIIAVWNGGLAIHGGIIAGVLVGAIVCHYKKISFLTMADTVIPGLPLGQAIGRWGNYFNQEAHGIQTDVPWAIWVNDAKLGMIRVHPTFLYESIWDVLVFCFLLIYERRFKVHDGELLFLYLIGYSFGRFFIEGLRTDSLMIMGLRTAQMVSLIGIIIGIVGMIYLKHTKKNPDA